TYLGKAIRAVAQNPDSCTLVGIRVERIYALTFGLGTALAAIAGLLGATLFPFNPSFGAGELLKSFVVVVLGGLGSVAGIGIAAALAWNWLGGYLGQVSFGHAAMFGLGGFVAAKAEISMGLPMVFAWCFGGVIAGLYALVWGHPTLRLRGPYFSIATIGVGEATRLVMTYWEDLTGGSSGLSLPITQGLKSELYWWALALMALVIAGSYALRKSTFGLGLLAIKSDVDAAADVGISPTLMQDIVLLLSGFTVGVCGAFYASYQNYIEPGDMFGFRTSISFVLMAVIGGVGTILGPALGALVFVILRQYLIGSYPQLYLGIYGLLLL